MLNTPCVLEKWRIQRDIETNTSLKCQVSSTKSENVCLQQSQDNRSFYSQWRTFQRLLKCDSYFENFQTVAYKKACTIQLQRSHLKKSIMS
jgi:hypothetical protein